MRTLNIRLLSLLYHPDEQELANFLADVQNINKLRIRALRLGGWRHLNSVERGIVSTTVRVLTRIKSKLLLATLVKIFMKIIPHLLSKFEQRFMQNFETLKEHFNKVAEEVRDIYVHRLRCNLDYLITEAWKHTIAEYTGAWTVYNEL